MMSCSCSPREMAGRVDTRGAASAGIPWAVIWTPLLVGPAYCADRYFHSTPPTPRLGSERELAAALALLGGGEARLLTLVGPGGVGKTRLGLQIAAEFAGAFADGVRFVDLSTIHDPALVASSIARALGVQ